MQQPLAKKSRERMSPLTSDTGGSVSGYYSASGLNNRLEQFNINPRQAAYAIQNWLVQLFSNEELISRTSAHVTVILLAIAAIGLSTIQWSGGGIKAIRPDKQVQAEPNTINRVQEESASFTLPATLNAGPDYVFSRAAVPRTIIPERTRQEISIYSVQSGDTIYGIAGRFGLAPETIMWSNPELEDSPDFLQVGQEITILPIDGIYHQVGGSDTIKGIASTYKTDSDLIINFPLNELNPDNPIITPGQWLVVPGGSKPFVPRAVTAYTGPIPNSAAGGTGAFVWPASGTIYQGFWAGHPAIDVAAWSGAPVLAADSGYVIVAGWDNSGYGYHVVVDHGNGFQTMYAHLQAYYVDAGENVVKGQQIGEMGSTGRSTGPHLHFEVRQGTIQRNPIGLLP